MKMINLAIFTSLLALAPALQAQEPDTITVPVRANDLRIELPESYKKTWPDRYDVYRGGYSLSNGRTLSLRAMGTDMYARVDDDSWHKLVAVAPNTFVALDRQLKMELNLHTDNDASGWLTMMVPARQLSDGGIVPEKIVTFAMR